MLFGAEYPVAGIAQPGNDVTVVVQVLIYRSGVDRNVRVGVGQDGEVERFLSPGRPLRLYGGVRYVFGGER